MYSSMKLKLKIQSLEQQPADAERPKWRPFLIYSTTVFQYPSKYRWCLCVCTQTEVRRGVKGVGMADDGTKGDDNGDDGDGDGGIMIGIEKGIKEREK